MDHVCTFCILCIFHSIVNDTSTSKTKSGIKCLFAKITVTLVGEF